MIELIATVTITLSSVLLFVYWFRYTCLLILTAKTAHDYATDFAATLGLSFPEVHAALQSDKARIHLEELHTQLDRDYAVVTHLLRHVVIKDATTSTIEVRQMEIHYRLLAIWFNVTKNLSATYAQSALEEMASVVTYFANTIGERAEAVLGA
jgi:hypothetical protein